PHSKICRGSGMIKTVEDQIYNRLKNNVGFHRSKKFKEWFHKKYPYCELHHLFGSVSQKLKTSDYCSIPVTRFEHQKAEANKSEFAIENLHNMINTMQEYIKYLEDNKK